MFECQVLVKCYYDGDVDGGFYWFKIGARTALYYTNFTLISPNTWPLDLAYVLAGQRRPIDLYSRQLGTLAGTWTDYTCCDFNPACGVSALDKATAETTPIPCP